MSKKLTSVPKQPGRGRPPKGRHADNSIAFSIRAQPDLLRQVDQSAALAGHSRSQHIQDLLRFAIWKANERRGDVRAIVETFAKIVDHAEHSTGLKWNENSATTAIIGLAIQGALSRYGSKDPITIPAKVESLALEGQKPPTTLGEVANIVLSNIIYEIEVSAFRDWKALESLRGSVRKGDTVIPNQWTKDAQILRELRSKPEPA